MNIVHIACVAPPETGGMGEAAYREVVGLRARGHQAVLLAPWIDKPSNDPAIVRLNYWWRFGNACMLRGLAEHIRSADVVHLHFPFYGTMGTVVGMCHRYRKPLVVTFHMDAQADDWRGSIFRVLRSGQNVVFSSARSVLVSSIDYAMQSSLSSWIRSHKDRVVELPFGIDVLYFSPGSEARHPQELLFVGGLDLAHSFKGLTVLLEAMVKLPALIHLRIVGDGDMRSEYEALVQRLELADRVRFEGKLPWPELLKAFQQASLLVLPSISSAEAFGLVAVEAQACATPVVASDWPGVRTVVLDGQTGWLVPPKSAWALTRAVEGALSDSAHLKQIGWQARQHVERRFDQEKHLDRLVEIYKKAL